MAATLTASARGHTPGPSEAVGAVLVADLAGFTPLTRVVAELGPRGVEALHAWLDETFSRLGACVAAEGGSVTAFAGDSLTAVFAGPGAPRRALVAARRMQADMARERPLLPAGAGAPPPAPQLRVGVAAGHAERTTLTWATGASPGGGGGTGSSHDPHDRREPACEVVWGDALSAAALAQTRATPGGIAVAGGAFGTDEAATQPPPPSHGTHEMREPPDRSRGTPRPGSRAGSRTGSRGAAEHRVVTTVFVALGATADGVGALADFLPEAAAVIDRCGGHLRQIDGCGPRFQLVLGFGAPRARPDDAAAAVSCARQLVGAASAAGLDAAAGIATGAAFCAELGSPEHREYVVVGPTVNLAARLAAAAADEPRGGSVGGRRAAAVPPAAVPPRPCRGRPSTERPALRRPILWQPIP